jgi:hypothetical protein
MSRAAGAFSFSESFLTTLIFILGTQHIKMAIAAAAAATAALAQDVDINDKRPPPPRHITITITIPKTRMNRGSRRDATRLEPHLSFFFLFAYFSLTLLRTPRATFSY